MAQVVRTHTTLLADDLGELFRGLRNEAEVTRSCREVMTSSSGAELAVQPASSSILR